MSSELNESRLNMWRAVIAMVHADGVVTPHEVHFVSEHTNSLNLSPKQREIIATDLKEPQDIKVMFSSISDKQDRKDFFVLARALSWCDGDFDAQEKTILEQLKQADLGGENIHLLEESRNAVAEIELCDRQWTQEESEGQSLSMFQNFLKKLRVA